MSELSIGTGIAGRGASGELLPSGITGPELLEVGKTTLKNTISVGLKDELPNNQGLSKSSGETLKYPIEDANPAYQARVSFRMFSLQPNKPGSTQKILDKQTEDNLRNQGVTSAFSEDTNFANLGAGPTTTASTRDFSDLGSSGIASIVGDDPSGGEGAAAEASARTGIFSDKAGGNPLSKFLKDKFKGSAFDAVVASAERGFTFQPVKDSPIVDMYFPLTMQFNDNAQYDNANLNGVGAGIEASTAAGADMLAATLGEVGNSVESVFQLITGNQRLGETAARLAAARLINFTPNEGIRNALTLTNRAIINPNVRALFRGVALREFTFQFKMIAESQQEAATVEKIVRHFRRELYPDTYSLPIGRDGVNADIGFKFPNVFEIIFKYKGAKNSKLPRLHHCYLRNVSYTVNPTGGAFRRDGQPNEIDLTLSFVERKTLSKNDIKDGY